LGCTARAALLGAPLLTLSRDRFRAQRTFNNNQAQSLYYTDRGPDVGYSINATALPMSLTNGHIGQQLLHPTLYRAMLYAAFQAQVRRE